MSVTQSPLIAALGRETRQMLGLRHIVIYPEARSCLSKCVLMGERADLIFTDSHEAN